MTDAAEIAYLDTTLAQLKKTYEKRSSDIANQDQHFKDLQRYMVDYKNELDKFEIYDFQQTLGMIDKRGLAQVMERERIKKLIESPYYGRFDFQYTRDDPSAAEVFYIGRFGFADEDGKQLIYDWRAPISNMLYEYELGPAHYVAMDRRFDGER